MAERILTLLDGVLASATDRRGAGAGQYRRAPMPRSPNSPTRSCARSACPSPSRTTSPAISPGTCRRAARLSRPSHTRPSRASSPSRRAERRRCPRPCSAMSSPRSISSRCGPCPAGRRPRRMADSLAIYAAQEADSPHGSSRTRSRARHAGKASSRSGNRPPHACRDDDGKDLNHGRPLAPECGQTIRQTRGCPRHRPRHRGWGVRRPRRDRPAAENPRRFA